ncbi:MAG: shikimate kinase [Bosea sp. (in: a-proteobacteria)]
MSTETHNQPATRPEALPLRARLQTRSIVLVGMMGSGKSSIGKRLAQRLELPFIDADTEIETAAAMTIPEIFAKRGEAEFRAGEKRVIERILSQGPQVLATGGGAFMNAETRGRISTRGISIWLRAEPDVLMRRVRKRANRPLLQTADPEKTLRDLLATRGPVYALADIAIESRDEPHEIAVEAILTALNAHLPGGPEQ